jgi:hypothetical protein
LTGFVDLGTGIDDDSAAIATESLVFMAVGLNEGWKVPVGYFFVNGLTGAEKANLVMQCLEKMADVGLKVVSQTCDGPSCHLAMMKELSVSANVDDLKPSFPNPGNPSEPIYIILDACHMLKLVRNTLASCGIIVDGDGNKVEWQYVESLHKLQQEEGLRLGNKLRAAHLAWKTQKMKVNLAAQTLSSSVADALHFCRDDLHLPEFSGSDATCRFIEYFDHLFDLLNSRNPFGKKFKEPLRERNEEIFLPFLEKVEAYIRSLRDPTGRPITSTPRKTAFIGFLMTLTSVKHIYFLHVKPSDSPLSYLLTYKLSQDHLELLFAGIRSAGGFNNNPTVRQFTACYKRMIVRHEIKCFTGNCLPQDNTTILHCGSSAGSLKSAVPDATGDMLVARRHDTILEEQPNDDHTQVEDLFSLSDFKEAVVGYISGYVVSMVKSRIHCEKCCAVLTAEFCEDNMAHSLIAIKDRGGLTKPSQSVVKVSLETERGFQRLLAAKQGLPRAPGVIPAITHDVLCKVASKTFDSLKDHMFDTEPTTNHVFALIKCISECYCKVRLHHLAAKYNEQVTGKIVRKTLGKLILFKHQ